MSLDPRYICASDLELYLVDKTSGLPLSGGIVTFYSDLNRAQKKKIYTISGTAPNYSFIELPNPSQLSAVGTFQDEGNNNVVPYYYPYDADGEQELYFITVESSTGVEQFTREAWPPSAAQASGGNLEANAVNYIPNGQFVAHTDVPADPINNIPFGQITQSITEIAQGGFNFHRPSGSTAIDNVQFFRYGEYVDNPSASPRYSVQIVNSTTNPSDSYKDLRIRFDDVNKFASLVDEYTFAFNGETFNSGDFQVTFNLIKFYGTGGSPSATEVITITEFNITSIQTLFQVSFNFGTNEGKGIGTNNDDFIELALQFPTNITFGGQFTDFMMFFGNVNILNFPPTTTNDFISRSLVPPPPEGDGSNLFLPLVLTKEGLGYDDSSIGHVEADTSGSDAYTGSVSTTTNLIKADGSQYLTAGYSPLGIPYARLQKKYQIDTLSGFPRYGTGDKFVTAESQGDPILIISTNKFGTAIPCADGTLSTGFNFFPICAASTLGFGIKAYLSNSTTITAFTTVAGTVTSWTAGNSGFTVSTFQDPSGVSTRAVFRIIVTVPTLLASKYFTFHSSPGNVSYYMWFTVDGTGTDPAPGGTGVRVNLKSTYSAAEVAYVVQRALSGCQLDAVTVTAGNTVSPGSYFTFTPSGTTQQYTVWFTVDGAGTAPVISGTFLIRVDILSSDTDIQVGTKTGSFINSTYFAVPNYEGQFLRGYDPNGLWDADYNSRSSFNPGIYQNSLGTFEPDEFLSHSHTYFYTPLNSQASGNSFFTAQSTTTSPQTSETGNGETRPINYNVQWLIRY